MTAKKSKTSGKKASSGNKQRRVEEGESKLPSERELQFIHSKPVPPPTSERLVRNVIPAFTPEVVNTLRRKEVSDFLGNRFKPRQVVEDTALAQEGASVEERLRHGADRAKQITEPAQMRLLEQASIVMRDIDELVAKYPDVGDGLQDLQDWWSAAFPGGPGKPKANGNNKNGGDNKGGDNKGGGGGGTSGGNGGSGGAPQV